MYSTANRWPNNIEKYNERWGVEAIINKGVQNSDKSITFLCHLPGKLSWLLDAHNQRTFTLL